MLQQILRLMSEGAANTQDELAKSLGVSAPLLSQMLGQLTRQGYLREAEQCGSGCTGCALATACGEPQALRIWTLTEKGQQAALRSRSDG